MYRLTIREQNYPKKPALSLDPTPFSHTRIGLNLGMKRMSDNRHNPLLSNRIAISP